MQPCIKKQKIGLNERASLYGPRIYEDYEPEDNAIAERSSDMHFLKTSKYKYESSPRCAVTSEKDSTKRNRVDALDADVNLRFESNPIRSPKSESNRHSSVNSFRNEASENPGRLDEKSIKSNNKLVSESARKDGPFRHMSDYTSDMNLIMDQIYIGDIQCAAKAAVGLPVNGTWITHVIDASDNYIIYP